MSMLKDPSSKYRAFPTINLPDRTWPSKTITLVVPFPPGGAPDLVGRTLAARLAERGLTIPPAQAVPPSVRLTYNRLARFGERVVLVNAVYDQIGDAIRDAGVSAVSGVLFDLGADFEVSPRLSLRRRLDEDGSSIGAYTLLSFVAITIHRRLLWFGTFEQAPACINVLDLGDDGWIVRTVNYVPYDPLHPARTHIRDHRVTEFQPPEPEEVPVPMRRDDRVARHPRQGAARQVPGAHVQLLVPHA